MEIQNYKETTNCSQENFYKWIYEASGRVRNSSVTNNEEKSATLIYSLIQLNHSLKKSGFLLPYHNSGKNWEFVEFWNLELLL